MRWFRRVLCVAAGLTLTANANASFMIRGATGSDGWAVPPHQNTAGRNVIPSYVVGSLENPIEYHVTFSRLEITTKDANDPNGVCAVIDGFGGIFSADDLDSLVVPGLPAEAPRVYEPSDPNQVNELRAVKTYCIVHSSEASLRAHPLIGDPNLSEVLALVVSAPLESGDYYLRYHWARRQVQPGTYYVALVTETTGAACGWRESIIDVSNDVWVDSLFPGEVFEYSDEPNEYPYASAAVDIYGYIKGAPMLIRNAISDDHLEPNAPAVAPTIYPIAPTLGGTVYIGEDGEVSTDGTLGGGVLRLAESARLSKLAWFGNWYTSETGSDWRFAIVREHSELSVTQLFWTDPLGPNTDVYTLEDVASTDFGQSTETRRLAHHVVNVSIVLPSGCYVYMPYALSAFPNPLTGWGNGGSAYWYPQPDLMWSVENEEYSLFWDFRWFLGWYTGIPVSGNAMVDIWAEVLPSYGPTDLARLSDNWLRTDSGPHNDWAGNADLNRDGKVDHDDFVILAADWTGAEAPVEPGTEPAFEDFETGDFSALDWQHSGHSPWVVTTSESYSGRYSARAGAVSDREKSTLTLTRTCAAGQISFYVKTSSEPSYDELHFRVDDQERGSYSGAEDWTYVTVSVTAGSHTFEWSYEKDSSVSEDDDTVWLDDVVFPVP